MEPDTTSLLSRQPSDEESFGKMVGSAQNDVSETVSIMGSGRKGGVPVAKVTGEGDDDENEVGSVEEETDEVERSYGVEKVVPRVRVFEEEEEEGGEEWGDPLEEPELETGNGDEGVQEEKGVVSLEVGNGEIASLKSTSVDSRDVDEWDGDAVVDNINVDFVEAVRSGVAVVGVDNNKGSEVEPVGEDLIGEKSDDAVEDSDMDAVVASTNEDDSVMDSGNVDVVESESIVDVAEDKEERKDSEVEVRETSVVKESADVDSSVVEDAGVASTNEDDSVMDSGNVDGVEPESVVDVAEDMEERKDSEVELRETSAVKESTSVDSDVTEAAGVKYTDEGDAIVDSINVDAVEAARSSIAIVGTVGEVKDSGEVVEDVALGLEDSIAEKYATEDLMAFKTDEPQSVGEGDNVVEAIKSGVTVAGRSESKDMELETKEVEAPVVENMTLANDFPPLADSISSEVIQVRDDELEEAQTNDAEVPNSVEISKLSDIEKTKSETDFISNEREPSVELQSSGGEHEKVQLDHVDDEPNSSPRSYASVLVDGPDVTAFDRNQVLKGPGDESEEAQTNAEKTNSEVDIISKEFEPKGESQFSGGENEKVVLHHVDGEPDASSIRADGENAIHRSYASVLVDGPNVAASNKSQLEQEKGEDGIYVAQENGDDQGSGTDGEGDLVYFGNGSSSRKAIEELETLDDSGMVDGQVVTDSEEGDSDEEGEGNELFDSAALAALLKAATGGGTDPGTITVRSQDGSRLFSMERPVGLEPSLRSARPSSGPTNSSLFSPTNFAPPIEENLSEEDKKKLNFLQQLKVKFLRLVQRVGFTAEHSLAAQVLYKLTVLAGRPVSPAFSLDNAKQTVMQLETEGNDDLDFSLNILVLGKSGVGKSAIINSVFGEEKVKINAFEPETTSVNMVYGTVDGVKIRFIDAPGLKSSAMEQGFNRKVLASVKKLTKTYPPDVMFYVDRLDSQTRDLNDLPLLKTISNSLGTSIWRNAIITLTHASSAPPDGPSGTPLSYEVFVAQRSHIVQQSIGQAVGEMRLMNLNMMNPVSLVENHSACRKNREGQKILPNGQAWKPQLLLLCYSVKILSEASAASKSQDTFDTRKLFGFRTRSPPLPYLLSSLLQPRAHPKLSADQGGDSVDSDVDLDDVSDSDQEEEEDEYDQLPPFKPLKKSQMAKLSSDQKKAYFEEYDYRVKLLQRKQWREELKRMREAKKNGKRGMDDNGEMPEDYDGENAPAAIPVPLPDMTLPPSFDSDNPAYRYRFLEPTSQFLARPVLDPHGWDHDCGYEGVNVEHTMGIAERFPASFTIQLNKDKKDFNVHLDSALSARHGENGSSLAGFDVQTIGKQYAYIVRGETKFKNLKKNKTAVGVTVTFLGENVATGVKVEDQIMLGKRLVLVGSTGTVRSQKDGAYGANLEVRLREADYPIGQEQSSFTLSLMKWRGDLAIGANLQSQISVGRNSKMVVRAALNNKMSGQITVRTSSSDHLSLALAALMPLAVAIYRKLRPEDVSENYSIY